MNLNQIFGSLAGRSQLGSMFKMVQGLNPGISASSTKGTEDYVAELALYVHVMMELLVEKGVISQEELEHKFNEIDLRDGKADGKLG